MARLYADECFSELVVEELRRLGHDVLMMKEAGRANQGIPDAEVLADAIRLGRAVITKNRWDFKGLHKKSPNHSGIIACTQDDDAVALATRIHQEILKYPSLDNQFINIYLPRKP
jgi:hypothetical protein